MVADRHVVHAVADRLDDPGALVPEHGRRIARRVDSRGGVHVGVTHAAGIQPHEHLAVARLGQVELLHDQRLTELLEHRGARLHDETSAMRLAR